MTYVERKGTGDVQQMVSRNGEGRVDRPGGDQGASRAIELRDDVRAELDILPRQVARFVDAASGSEWVVDARRCGAHIQVRAVEYASDGSWMPHVWRDVPAGAAVHFVPGRGVEVRGVSPSRTDV